MAARQVPGVYGMGTPYAAFSAVTDRGLTTQTNVTGGITVHKWAATPTALMSSLAAEYGHSIINVCTTFAATSSTTELLPNGLALLSQHRRHRRPPARGGNNQLRLQPIWRSTPTPDLRNFREDNAPGLLLVGLLWGCSVPSPAYLPALCGVVGWGSGPLPEGQVDVQRPLIGERDERPRLTQQSRSRSCRARRNS